MHIAEHEQRCLNILGGQYTEIHTWLDQYYNDEISVAHRVALHHRPGIELGVTLFGESARKALELHVEDDFEFIPDTPEDVVQMMRDQDFWSSTEIDIMQPILDELWYEVSDGLDNH